MRGRHRAERLALIVLGLAWLLALAPLSHAQEAGTRSPESSTPGLGIPVAPPPSLGSGAAADSSRALERGPLEPAPAHYTLNDDGLDDLRHAYRSTTAAVVMSVPFPGWGQFYGDAPFWGVVSFAVQMWFYGNIVLETARSHRQEVAGELAGPGSSEQEYRAALAEENSARATDYVWWAAGSVLLVSLDAYVSVQLVDFDSPDPPTPDLDHDPAGASGNGGGLALTLQLPF